MIDDFPASFNSVSYFLFANKVAKPRPIGGMMIANCTVVFGAYTPLVNNTITVVTAALFTGPPKSNPTLLQQLLPLKMEQQLHS